MSQASQITINISKQNVTPQPQQSFHLNVPAEGYITNIGWMMPTNIQLINDDKILIKTDVQPPRTHSSLNLSQTNNQNTFPIFLGNDFVQQNPQTQHTQIIFDQKEFNAMSETTSPSLITDAIDDSEAEKSPTTIIDNDGQIIGYLSTLPIELVDTNVNGVNQVVYAALNIPESELNGIQLLSDANVNLSEIQMLKNSDDELTQVQVLENLDDTLNNIQLIETVNDDSENIEDYQHLIHQQDIQNKQEHETFEVCPSVIYDLNALSPINLASDLEDRPKELERKWLEDIILVNRALSVLAANNNSETQIVHQKHDHHYCDIIKIVSANQLA